MQYDSNASDVRDGKAFRVQQVAGIVLGADLAPAVQPRTIGSFLTKEAAHCMSEQRPESRKVERELVALQCEVFAGLAATKGLNQSRARCCA